MNPVLLTNLLLLTILGLVCFGLSVLKRQLLRLAHRLSHQPQGQCPILPRPSQDCC